jgi:prevent-host-death family protein
MELVRIGSDKLRSTLGAVIDRVQRGECDVIVTRYVRPIVAVIPYRDYLAVKDTLDRIRAERGEKGEDPGSG